MPICFFWATPLRAAHQPHDWCCPAFHIPAAAFLQRVWLDAACQIDEAVQEFACADVPIPALRADQAEYADLLAAGSPERYATAPVPGGSARRQQDGPQERRARRQKAGPPDTR